MKYVILDSPLHGIYPVLFPNHIEHSYAKSFPGIPVSAGFVNAKLSAYGESESLKLKSRPEDSRLFVKLMRN